MDKGLKEGGNVDISCSSMALLSWHVCPVTCLPLAENLGPMDYCFATRTRSASQEASNVKARLCALDMSLTRLNMCTGGVSNSRSSPCFRHGVLNDAPNDYYHVAKMIFRCVKANGTDRAWEVRLRLPEGLVEQRSQQGK